MHCCAGSAQALVSSLQQSSTPPQPSDCCPQSKPRSSQLWGVQAAAPPQRLGSPPPPQVSGAVQPPHSIKLPQPSATGPQSPGSQRVLQSPELLPPPLA